LYDEQERIGGMAHVMLPREHSILDMAALKRQGIGVKGQNKEARFCDVGVDWMMEEMITRGAHKSQIRAKITGGAEMFRAQVMADSLGMRNVHSVRERLSLWNIPVVDEDVGGVQGRTVTFFLTNGSVRVELPNQEVYL
jgi:chemotaxis protein CheD